MQDALEIAFDFIWDFKKNSPELSPRLSQKNTCDFQKSDRIQKTFKYCLRYWHIIYQLNTSLPDFSDTEKLTNRI